MRFFTIWSLVYTGVSLISFIHFVNTSSVITLALSILAAIRSAEYGIIAKIIEHKPKEDAK